MRIIATAHCKECRQDIGTQTGETPNDDPATVARARKDLAADLCSQIVRERKHEGHSITIQLEGAG